MAAANRGRLEELQSSKEENEPKLKCHEMRIIFQRLPTAELIRFVSNQPKHPLGKFWSQELKCALEKRLPFSVKATATSRGAASDHVISDCNGSLVAYIKRPKQFHLSPLCELIESAEVPAIGRTVVSLPPQFAFPTPDILATLKNLDTLTLSTSYFKDPKMRVPVDLPAALSPEVMSSIKSLTLVSQSNGHRFEKPALEILARSSNLKSLCLRLDLKCKTPTWLAALSRATDGNEGLQSLNIRSLVDSDLVQPCLQITTTRFNGLRQLFVPVRAPIRQYLAAFQALTSLAKLGLCATRLHPDDKKSVDENHVSIVSVTDLFVELNYQRCGSTAVKDIYVQALLAVFSKFPNVRTFGAEFTDGYGLRFASAICTSGVFGHLQALKLFTSWPNGLRVDALLQFIRANVDHLPSSVDLSQVTTVRPTNLDRDFLVDVCLALQGGRITSLALKGLVHWKAVQRLRDQFALTKQETNGDCGKVLAWIDEGSVRERSIQSRAAWWPEAASAFTDFLIDSHKTSGPLKGAAFKARISNWTETRERLFDDFTS